ncbi:MAG: hypothetical protein ABFC24_00430 [Methanoregulaceae archaeon]
MGDYEQKTDIVVVKLTPNGDVSWSKVLDSGDSYDIASSVFEGSDGSVYIGGFGWNHYPWLIKLSSQGDLLWNCTFIFYGYGSGIYAINETQDHTIVTTTWEGTIYRFDPNGTRLNDGYHTGIDVPSIESMPDGGFRVIGNTIATFDRNGTFTGNISATSTTIQLTANLTPAVTQTPSINDSSNGTGAENPILKNASSVVTRTRDGGYFTSGLGRNGSYTVWVPGRVPEGAGMAVKLNPDGTIAWEKQLLKIKISNIKRVIQTHDGGYVVVGEYDRAFDTVFDKMFG